jgi:GDP-4-dehydro-6-deoxy-D-mannose reductase
MRPASIAVGNIQIKRDFTDVRDVVRAYFLLLEHGVTGEVYNVCSGVAVRLADILGMFQSVCGVEVKIEIDVDRLRTSDPLEICGNPAKLNEATGWRTQIPLSQTISDTLDYWKTGLKRTNA